MKISSFPKAAFLFFLLFNFSFISFSFEYKIKKSLLPEFSELSYRNVLFAQYCQTIEDNSKLLSKGEKVPLSFYKYKCKKNENLFLISSRLSLRQETLATLNQIENPSMDLENRTIIVPDLNGIFVAEKSCLSYEIIIKENLKNKISEEDFEKLSSKILVFENKNSDSVSSTKSTSIEKADVFYFFQGLKLDGAERAYFLDSSMKLPVENYVISSDFGYRTSPISGRWIFHRGIDLASSKGSKVFACKNGEVIKCGFDNIYGNHIIIKHDGNKESLYAHLDSFSVKKGEIISGGKEIGKVGTTGLSTGPHLHFEFHDGNSAKNPKDLIKF